MLKKLEEIFPHLEELKKTTMSLKVCLSLCYEDNLPPKKTMSQNWIFFNREWKYNPGVNPLAKFFKGYLVLAKICGILNVVYFFVFQYQKILLVY